MVGVQVLTAARTGGVAAPADLIDFAESEGWTGEVPPLADRFEEVADHFFPGENQTGVVVLIAPDMTIAIKRTPYETALESADIAAVL